MNLSQSPGKKVPEKGPLENNSRDKKSPDEKFLGKKSPPKNGPWKKSPRKNSLGKTVLARLFPTVWCMWDRGLSVEHLLVYVGSPGGINR